MSEQDEPTSSEQEVAPASEPADASTQQPIPSMAGPKPDAHEDRGPLPPQPNPPSRRVDGAAMGATKRRSTILAVAAALVMLLILALVVWSGNVRAEARRRETLAHAIDAIVVAATPTLLQQRSERTERLAHSIREAGQFASVSFTDGQGNVLVTTDSRYKGTTIEELKLAPRQCRVDSVRGKLRAFRAIVVGTNNVIGGVQIDLEP